VKRVAALAAAGLALALGLLPVPGHGEEAAPPVPAREAAAAPAPAPEVAYDVEYEVRIVPTEGSARVAIRLSDPQDGLLSIRFAHDPERHLEWTGTGDVLVEDRWVAWTPPRQGGVLRYTVRIDRLRNEHSYDARATRHWVLLRGDALVPPARVRTDRMAHAVAHLRLRLPEGWSAVLPYRRLADGRYAIDHPRRRFDRPVGWMVFGKLGVVRERVSGTSISIGGPVGHGQRRQDMLALLRWTLPTLRKIAPLPERIAVVGASDPMWRGGLSGPDSVYLHAARPLILEDGTSPLLHEIVHVWMGARAGTDGDWIVEGLADLYSLEALYRSKTISKRRYERALERLAARGRGVRSVVATERASGAVTARSVGLLRDLDAEIRAATGGERGLDDVVRELTRSPEAVSLAHFRALCERVAGTKLRDFFARRELSRVP
jgi:hypothetical protein